MERQQFEVIRTTPRFSEIKKEWQDLWAHSEGAYYHEFDCCLWSWLSIHEPEGRSLRVLTLRDSGTLVAALPMTCYWKGPWKLAKTLGQNAAEGGDILIRQDPDLGPSTAREVWKEFIKRVKPHLASFASIKRGSMLEAAIAPVPRSHVLAVRSDQTPYASLRDETDWNAYQGSLSKDYRSQMARKRRRLSEQGSLSMECVTEDQAFYAKWLLDNKMVWSERTKYRGARGAWLHSPHYRNFLCNLVDRSQHVLTFALKLDDTPVAVKIFGIGPVFSTLIIGSYDERYGKYSPGNILDEFCMQHMFENFRGRDGRRLDVDFGAGKEAYKMHWARGNAVDNWNLLFATSRWGVVPRHIKDAVGKLKAVAQRARPEPATARP